MTSNKLEGFFSNIGNSMIYNGENGASDRDRTGDIQNHNQSAIDINQSDFQLSAQFVAKENCGLQKGGWKDFLGNILSFIGGMDPAERMAFFAIVPAAIFSLMVYRELGII